MGNNHDSESGSSSASRSMNGPGSLAYSFPAAPPTYPAITPTLHSSPIEILSTEGKGRGVYAKQDLAAGTVVDISPVLLLSNEEYYGGGKEGDGKGVEGSVLRGYVFTWKGKEGGMALALGLGSLFNHSSSPNVNFELQPVSYTIQYKTFRSIKAGEELCIFYGHKTRFEGQDSADTRSSSASGVDDDPSSSSDELWGGLGGIDAEAGERRIAHKAAKAKKRWDNEIIPFSQLEWNKITNLVDPEDQPLVTMDAWVMDIPAKYVQPAFQWLRKINKNGIDELAHLKRVRNIPHDPDRDTGFYVNGQSVPASSTATSATATTSNSANSSRSHSPTPVEAEGDRTDVAASTSTTLPPRSRFAASIGHQRHMTGPDTPVSVLLFPVATAPDDLLQQVSEWAQSLSLTSLALTSCAQSSVEATRSSHPELPLHPYVVSVPSQIARTDQQAREWGRLWPVQMVHIREGPRARPRAQGWERVKQGWVRREGERVWAAAQAAAAQGEHPIACHVTDTYNPDVHSATNLPVTLVRAFDTRKSTHNCLSHAAANAIDAVAVLDRQNLRGPALLPDLPPPYLLTGQTVFMSHEPCLLCSMSLLHSRIAALFYIKKSPGSGGLGSVYSVHEDGGLNHRFEVWEWRGDATTDPSIGRGFDVKLDT